VPATAVGLLPAVPVAVFGLSQRNEQVRWLHAPSASMAILAPRAIFWSTSVAVIILSLAVAAWRPQARTWLLVGWGLGPPAALFIVSYLTPLFLPRYVLYVIPAWCLLAAATIRGVSAADRRWVALLRGAVVTMLIFTVSAKAQMEIRQVPQRQGFDYADVFGVIRAGYRPGDGIAYLASDWRLMLPPASTFYLPTDKRPREVFATVPARRAGWWVSTECASVAACQTDASRVWVVRSGNGPDPLADLQQPVQSVLREGYSITEIHHGSITVALLTRR
jgi:mannosyltransferase